MYALVDCNNFFASCERVFNPALENKPIVGAFQQRWLHVARSNEAKQLVFPPRRIINGNHYAINSACMFFLLILNFTATCPTA